MWLKTEFMFKNLLRSQIVQNFKGLTLKNDTMIAKNAKITF